MRSKAFIAGVIAVVVVSIAVFAAIGAAAEPKGGAAKQKKDEKPTAAAEKNVKPEDCYACHGPVKELHAGGKHAKVNCASCHRGLEKHAAVKGPDGRPETEISWETCGACHPQELESFKHTATHRPARDEKSQMTGRAPEPYWDKLMMGHGFTKEHNATRSHAWMLVDQFVVDRAFGGRFQPKEGWEYVNAPPGSKVWDVLKDTHPETSEHKPFITQSAAAANATCLQCKSQGHILSWPYTGDPAAKAPWSRASNPVELARTLNEGLSCIYCHDPHAAKPRIVRDALIQALTRPEADTLWHKDKDHTGFKVVDMGLRGYPRKIAILDKYDSRLQCGQCHVEYNCNQGYDPKNPDSSKYTVTYADPRTNHFPYKDVFDLYDHYVNKVSFLDFKHGLTGGLLWKAQHPEAETYYNSVHAQNGVGCDDCHTPRLKDPKGGKKKEYTSHFAVTPRVQLKETCLKCHAQWTEEQARYAIDSVKAHIKGKMRKAEFWISELIDAIVAAQKAGADPEAIRKAQDQHLRAHILWEYWTAENSDGFHNPAMARESLTRSVDESQKGIKILKEAPAQKPKP